MVQGIFLIKGCWAFWVSGKIRGLGAEVAGFGCLSTGLRHPKDRWGMPWASGDPCGLFSK